MRFGELLRQYREKQNIQQKDLAADADISPAMLSQIEHAREFPTEELANRLMDALKISGKRRESMLRSLKNDRKSFYLDKSQAQKFGEVLSDLLKTIDLSVADLARKIDVSVVIVYSWMNGSKLPGDKTLALDLIEVFREAGASEQDLQRLKYAHLEGKLAQSIDLAYLTKQEQDELMAVLEEYLNSKQ